jgi:uncharacterized protein
MHSRIYQGWIRHRRLTPRRHSFRYRVFLAYLDLAELPTVFAGIPLWSTRRPAPARFKRSDYFGAADRPLDDCVRDLVAERTGRRPQGPVRLLTNLRYFGYCFNPVSFYYCYDVADTRVETVVAEVTNTPWGERHQYVLPVAEASRERALHHWQFDKKMHVSPFMPMDIRYAWRCNDPGERLFVHIENWRLEQSVFDATMLLKAQPIAAAPLLTLLLTQPLMTWRVTAAIHWQAINLWLKKTPFHSHPKSA